MKVKYFEEASNQFYENSKLFDLDIKDHNEELNTYAGLYNLAEGLKRVQESINEIMIQLEYIESILDKESGRFDK